MSPQGQMESPSAGQDTLPMVRSLHVGWYEHRDDGPFELPGVAPKCRLLAPKCRLEGHGSCSLVQANLGGPTPFASFHLPARVG